LGCDREASRGVEKVSDYYEIDERCDLEVCTTPECDKDRIENRNVRNYLLKIFFKELEKCPHLGPKEESEIGERLKKAKRKEVSWIKKISQLAFKHRTVSSGLSRTLDSIKIVRNPVELCEHKVKLFQLIKGPDRVKLKEYWSFLEKVKKEINTLTEILVVSHLRLVIHIAKKYKYYGLDLLDLIQEGNIGLIKATQCWEYQINTKFSTYATWWVRQRIVKALSLQSKTVRRPMYLDETIKKIDKTRSGLMRYLEREPSFEEIAKNMNLSLKRIEKIFEVPMIKCISLATPINGGDGEFWMLMEDKKAEDPLNKAADQVFKEEVEKHLAVLTPRERNIIELRFGIGEGNYEHTLEEIGIKFHFTRERARQIEKRVLRKLRYPLRRFL